MNIYKKSDIPEHLQKYFERAEIGLEKTPDKYIQRLVEVFREVKRVMKDDGTLWLNLGDSYAAQGARGNNNGEGQSTMGWPGQRQETLNKAAKIKLPPVDHGLKPKDLIGIPWRVAFALQADGWYLRQDIIWHKPNPMPESVTDRCTKSHEYIFLLTKSAKYWYDNEAIKEDSIDKESYTGRRKRNAPKMASYDIKNFKKAGSIKEDGTLTHGQVYEKRNKRSVWTVNTKPYKEAHFAVFPDDLIKPCILAGSQKNDIVIDPFFGSGTTGEVALRAGRQFIGCELNPDYIEIANKRLEPYLNQTNLF